MSSLETFSPWKDLKNLDGKSIHGRFSNKNNSDDDRVCLVRVDQASIYDDEAVEKSCSTWACNNGESEDKLAGISNESITSLGQTDKIKESGGRANCLKQNHRDDFKLTLLIQGMVNPNLGLKSQSLFLRMVRRNGNLPWVDIS